MWLDLGAVELIQYENLLGFRLVIRSQTPENPEGQELKTEECYPSYLDSRTKIPP